MDCRYVDRYAMCNIYLRLTRKNESMTASQEMRLVKAGFSLELHFHCSITRMIKLPGIMKII